MDQQNVSSAAMPKARRIVSLIMRFKWIVIAVIVIAAALVAFQAYRANIDKRWNKARDYYTKADYEKAAKELKGLSMPKDAGRLRVYAQTMLATQQLDNAAKGYEKLYEAQKDPFDKVVLGNIYNQQKKYDQAAKIYKEVIKSNPAYIQAYVNLATMYRLQNDNKAAIEIAKNGVAANDKNEVLAELLVSLTMGDKNTDDYKQAVESLKSINPNNQLLQALEQ